MASINFFEKAYEYNNLKEEVVSEVSHQSMNGQIAVLLKEISSMYSAEISAIKNKTMKQSVIEEKIDSVIIAKNLSFGNISKQKLLKLLIDELFGYSILQKYIEDPEVNDIMVNDYNNIFIRKGMKDIKVEEKFYDSKTYEDFLLKICAFIGKKLNMSSPQVEGSDTIFDLRIYISQNPINTYAPSLVIRKSHKSLNLDDVISEKVFPKEIIKTIHLLKDAGNRVILAGPMESGKTTFMNAYLNLIDDQRIIIMEDTPEMVIKNENTLYLKTVKNDANESMNIDLSSLVRSFKRSNGTMPVVSEVRGIEAVELLDIFNAGFIRGCTSLHANSAEEVIRQLVFQIKASNKLGNDRKELEEYLSRTIDVIIYMEKRKIISISEVCYNFENEKIEIRDIHRFIIEKETRNQLFGKYALGVNTFSDKMLDRIRRVGKLNEVPENLITEKYKHFYDED